MNRVVIQIPSWSEISDSNSILEETGVDSDTLLVAFAGKCFGSGLTSAESPLIYE